MQGFVADDGAVTVVEINPRFSGGLPLTLAAGADVVAAYLAGVREPHAPLPDLSFRPGVSMSRYFAETYAGRDGSPVVDPCAPRWSAHEPPAAPARAVRHPSRGRQAGPRRRARCRPPGTGSACVDTGQHTDPAMGSELQAALGLHPRARASQLPTDPAERAGALHADAARAVARSAPDVVLALGDTATVPAYALAARAAGVPFVHLEAGLRSFNARSVEEVNRRVAAATASLHLAPTKRAAAFLSAEGVDAERVFVVGNPVIDTLVARGVRRVPPAERSGVLVTAHRATNVDDPVRLARLVAVVRGLAERGRAGDLPGAPADPRPPRRRRARRRAGPPAASASPGRSATTRCSAASPPRGWR